MSITGALDSVGSPASIFKFAGGQKYGCFDANNTPIICDPSIDPATPGTLFNFTKCENIILSNIEGDGNNSNMIIGGSNNGGVPNGLGDSINDIQVAASGLRIDGYNKNFNVSDCNFNHFCLDGITINGEIAVDTISGTVFPNFLTKDQSAGLAYNLFQNIDCNNNSRIGISISAGKYIKLLECDILNTGQDSAVGGKILANAPATGIDIEPNGYLPPNAPLDGCSQIVIEECNVKYSYAHALTILSIIHPSNPNADFVSQWITSKNSYYADYDDISLQIAWSPGTQATVESNGLNVTFEGDTIVGSFWRGVIRIAP
ncbi:MAG: hypothetical protein HWD58_20040 [Bacteroidota bacterium]|nr:MAG: hypothetical protein HWD58_20040 [Bacteroidota bacterium]